MDLDNYKFIKGTPSMVLMPARDYVFRVSNEHHVIRIPRRGKYFDIDPEFFKEEDGEFSVFDEETNIFYTPTIIKILLATKQYPELDFNQFFVPYIIKIEGDEVIIVGQVADMMIEKKAEDVKEEQ